LYRAVGVLQSLCWPQQEKSSIVKHLPLSSTLLFLAGLTPALADPTMMLGGTVTFGANTSPSFGVTVRLLENNRVNESTLGAGLSYYLGSGQIGVDVFAGFLFEKGVFGFGYDLVQGKVIASLGVVDTQD
jgi:hypothetical protein